MCEENLKKIYIYIYYMYYICNIYIYIYIYITYIIHIIDTYKNFVQVCVYIRVFFVYKCINKIHVYI